MPLRSCPLAQDVLLLSLAKTIVLTSLVLAARPANVDQVRPGPPARRRLAAAPAAAT
jgi:hypothetical protein